MLAIGKQIGLAILIYYEQYISHVMRSNTFTRLGREGHIMRSFTPKRSPEIISVLLDRA
jgi:hypothetical protein